MTCGNDDEKDNRRLPAALCNLHINQLLYLCLGIITRDRLGKSESGVRQFDLKSWVGIFHSNSIHWRLACTREMKAVGINDTEKIACYQNKRYNQLPLASNVAYYLLGLWKPFNAVWKSEWAAVLVCTALAPAYANSISFKEDGSIKQNLRKTECLSLFRSLSFLSGSHELCCVKNREPAIYLPVVYWPFPLL